MFGGRILYPEFALIEVEDGRELGYAWLRLCFPYRLGREETKIWWKLYTGMSSRDEARPRGCVLVDEFQMCCST